MNNSTINFFPMLDEDQLKQLNLKINYKFYYYSNLNEKKIISYNINNKNYINLDLKNQIWNTYNYDLYLEISIEGCNGEALYGQEGIAPTGSFLSLCVEWLSPKAKKRDVIKSKNFIFNNEEIFRFSFELMFQKNTFEHDIQINILIYLAECTTNLVVDELFLNNYEGVVLGYLDSKILYMSGVSSLFPIYLKEVNDARLWILEINYDDPTTDTLSDSIKLILNTKHKDYKYLDTNSPVYCERLVFEIVINVITLLINDLKEKNYLNDLDCQFNDGSILKLAKYYKNVLEIDIQNCNLLDFSNSLRLYLNSKE